MVNPGTAEPIDSHRIALSDHDILVLRGDFKEGYAQSLQGAIQQKNPNWDGLMICLGADQDLSQMPEPVARELYAGLHRVFGAPKAKKKRPNSRQKRKLRAQNTESG